MSVGEVVFALGCVGVVVSSLGTLWVNARLFADNIKHRRRADEAERALAQCRRDAWDREVERRKEADPTFPDNPYFMRRDQ